MSNWKFYIVKAVVFSYLLAGVYFSFKHLIHAAEKLGAESAAEAWATPLGIDGFFIVGLVMRHDDWSSRSKKIGFWVMVGAATASLAGNVYAGLGNPFSIGFGAALPAAIIFTEWLVDPKQMETAGQEKLRLEQEATALAAMERATQIAANRAAGVAKAKATREGKMESTVEEPKKRTRRTKAQIEADRAAANAGNGQLMDQGGSKQLEKVMGDLPKAPPKSGRAELAFGTY